MSADPTPTPAVPAEIVEELQAYGNAMFLQMGVADARGKLLTAIAALCQPQPVADQYEKCPDCDGSGLALNTYTGEPTECRECKGNTVVPVANQDEALDEDDPSERAQFLRLAQGVEDALKARGSVALDNEEWRTVFRGLRLAALKTADRAAILEEAAAVADEIGTTRDQDGEPAEMWVASQIADAIRALKAKEPAQPVADRDVVLEELVAALEFYADPQIYKPHPHGPAFDNRDLSYHAKAALAKALSANPPPERSDATSGEDGR